MQDSGTTPLQSAGFLGTLTTVHFVIIAILAVLAIIGILYGMKLSRERRAATRELEEAGHLRRTGDVPVADPDAPGEPVATPAPGRVEQPAPVVQEPVLPVSLEPVTTPLEQPIDAPLPPMAAPEPPIAAPEPPIVSSEPARAPFVESAAPVVPATPAGTDLTRLKGLGPKVAAMLVEQGIPDVATLALLPPDEAEAVAARLGVFAPRMAKDRWVEQARYLAAGDVAGFEAVFGKL
ncbi:hypothetical protein [Sphingomonas sp. Leaf10]|uniref:hypothetical protein n=1 Tax=Sphingomonas sp. Leaf10 TaxID=1735676 RepID=UPI0007016819|nr:hypothetical protein [Sphingomonas sp. Leaf10]KQM30574.1 hypothetical protein ASE59_08390 [Sphingomonas sp. Leaf10]